MTNNTLICFRETLLGNTIIGLFVYGALTTIIIIILIWVLKNNFRKNKEETKSQQAT